jgi:hypothetical protein
MSISITNLKAAIDLGNGPTMASQFQVVFRLPVALKTGNEAFTSSTLSILCQSATLAGTQVATTELPIYGPGVKMPYGLIYQDLNISFLCTNTMAQRKVFEEWRRIIIDPTTNYVNYYDTYVGEIIVQKLNQSGEAVHSVLYEEAFPVAIFEQELSSTNNDWLRLSVQFSYRRWRTRLDLNAASSAGFGSIDIPQAPGEEENPSDLFKNTPAPRVPEFKP